jgi:hypothetical protein
MRFITKISVLVPAGAVVISLGALAAVGRGGWPGESGVSAIDYCEAIHGGMVKQPANTWSNLVFVVVGLLIGLHAARNLKTALRSNNNAMLATAFYPTFYASVSALLGPGSMAMHASDTGWGGKVDVFSMYLWAAWILTYAFTRLLRLGKSGFLVIYTVVVPLVSFHLFTDLLQISTHVVFGGLIASAVLLELLLLARRSGLSAGSHYFYTALGVFSIAFSTWVPSQTGGPLCWPDSLFQLHALWHTLSAVAVGLLYLGYCRYEIPLFKPITETLVQTEEALA